MECCIPIGEITNGKIAILFFLSLMRGQWKRSKKNFAKIPSSFLPLERVKQMVDCLLKISYTHTVDNDINKKICARCSKNDCAQCVEEDGKSFCCHTCCGEYKKEKEGEKKEEPVNICRFC